MTERTTGEARDSLRVAYLINQYPKLSHSFIRREIRALEAQGVRVQRIAVRRVDEELRNQADREEAELTRMLLDGGLSGLAGALARAVATRPVRLARAIREAVKVGFRSERGVAVHLVYVAEACLAREWLAAEGAEHVHAHFGTNATTVAMLARILGGPSYSFTVHGPEEFDRPEALSLREKIRHASFVAGVSEFGRSQLMRWSDAADWERLEVVHCGLDRRLLTSPVAFPPDVPRLFSVGRLCVEKAQHVLVDAAARLAERGVAFELRIGGEGPLRPEIEARIARWGLKERVVLLGALDEKTVRTEMEAARAVVLPSFAEGLPVVLMEALAAHRPVVTSTVAGIPELVVDGECGWLVAPGSVDALAEALDSALRTPVETLAEMGASGAGRVARAHDVDCEAARLASLFQKVARRSTSESGS